MEQGASGQHDHRDESAKNRVNEALEQTLQNLNGYHEEFLNELHAAASRANTSNDKRSSQGDLKKSFSEHEGW